jgi:hypothetical protein
MECLILLWTSMIELLPPSSRFLASYWCWFIISLTAPTFYPIDLFEHLWLVDRLVRLGISTYFTSEIKECLEYVYRYEMGVLIIYIFYLYYCHASFSIELLTGIGVTRDCFVRVMFHFVISMTLPWGFVSSVCMVTMSLHVRFFSEQESSFLRVQKLDFYDYILMQVRWSNSKWMESFFALQGSRINLWHVRSAFTVLAKSPS